MKVFLINLIAVLSLKIATLAVSGISRLNIYQGDECEEIRKLRRF